MMVSAYGFSLHPKCHQNLSLSFASPFQRKSPALGEDPCVNQVQLGGGDVSLAGET